MAVQEEENITFCNGKEGPEDYHAKWNKPVGESQIPYEHTYMWNLMNKL